QMCIRIRFYIDYDLSSFPATGYQYGECLLKMAGIVLLKYCKFVLLFNQLARLKQRENLTL
ncbi:hypothetical protein, partial [Klebsiella pneumoniae]|uniref:hypothetical protein n=1 Tax=Klebsiella pneumoniae TaxID=573 RepID=UPI00197AFA94